MEGDTNMKTSPSSLGVLISEIIKQNYRQLQQEKKVEDGGGEINVACRDGLVMSCQVTLDLLQPHG